MEGISPGGRSSWVGSQAGCRGSGQVRSSGWGAQARLDAQVPAIMPFSQGSQKLTALCQASHNYEAENPRHEAEQICSKDVPHFKMPRLNGGLGGGDVKNGPS